MNTFVKTIVCFFLLFGIFSSAQASNISDQRLVTAYNKFIVKVDAQLSQWQKIILLEKLWNKIDIFFETKKLSEKNINILSDLNRLNNEELFAVYFENQKSEVQSELSQYSSIDKFNLVSQNPENIFLENDIWYFYDFQTTSFFDKNNVDLRTLTHNDIDVKTDLVVLRDTGWPGFATEFDKVKLISDSIIYGIPDKYEFLKEVRNDQRHMRTSNTDEVFLSMKNQAESILFSSKKQDKITAVYSWILDNISYTENLDLNDKRIFSWSATYNNKDGVCEWYTKLMMYMLNFAGVRNSVVIRWDIIDAPDFPQIWHAWVRVGQDFYDPTFDDPIGVLETRSSNKYRYYKLPKDLMYTNRFDFWKTPQALKGTNLVFREKLVWTKLFALTNKYSSTDYLLLGPSEFRKSLGLTFDDTIDFQDLKNKMTYLEVQTNFSTILDGKTRFLQWFQFYALEKDGTNIDPLLNQLNYNLDEFYLMKFYTDEAEDGFEYRLAYNVQFR